MHINTWDYLKNDFLYQSVNRAIAGNQYRESKLYNATKYLNNNKYTTSIPTRINRFVKHIFKYIFNLRFRQLFNDSITEINKRAARNNLVPNPQANNIGVHRNVRVNHILPLLDLPTVFAFGASSKDFAADALVEIRRREPDLLQGTNLVGVRGVLYAKQKNEDELDFSRLMFIQNHINGVKYRSFDELVASGAPNLQIFINNGIRRLPPELTEIDVKQLYLERSNITQLPSNIGKIKSLTHFAFKGGHLSEVPEEIGNLTNLIHLDFGPSVVWHPVTFQLINNKLTKLPNTLRKLQNLRYLDLSCSQLTEVSLEICSLVNLYQLRLARNQITELRSEIGELIDLQTLHIARNQLTRLPSEIGLLTNLRHLDISGNQLTALPASIEQLINLHTLDIRSNMFSPAAIAQIRAWLPNTNVII